MPEMPEIDIPTAAEIAALIVVEGMDNAKLNELYTDHFKEDTWEDVAIALAIEELEDDNYEIFSGQIWYR